MNRKRTAIITGAGRGIGRSIALALAADGIQTALTARTKSELETVRDEITADGGSAEIFPADLSNEQEVKTMVASVAESFGGLDIVVNNAGTGIYKLLEETSTEDWDTTMATNARGAFLVCRECLPHLRKNQTGWIINISSVVGVKGYANQAAYSASKHALMGMTKALAREVQPHGIRVHAICPGGVDTEMVARARPDIDRSELISADEVADAVKFLVNQSGNGIIDEIHIRRYSSLPWP